MMNVLQAHIKTISAWLCPEGMIDGRSWLMDNTYLRVISGSQEQDVERPQ